MFCVPIGIKNMNIIIKISFLGHSQFKLYVYKNDQMAAILKIKMAAIRHPWYTSNKVFPVLWDLLKVSR